VDLAGRRADSPNLEAAARRGFLHFGPVGLERGQAVSVSAGARHALTDYEGLSLLVIFAQRWRLEPRAGAAPGPV